jgi:hypothetical protein
VTEPVVAQATEVNTVPANAEAAAPSNAQVLSAERGVSVSRGGQPVMPQLPAATATVAPAASQPVHPLVPVGVAVLMLAGLSAVGALFLRRRKKQ